jgi:3-oxoacyl-(acyl-carrier-protein) synthase
LNEGLLPPSVALEKPIVDWDFVQGKSRDCNGHLKVALSTNSAFGGNNSALVLRRHSSVGQA